MEEQIEKNVLLDKEIYKPEKKTVNLGNRRCIDMKNNRRIIFPPGCNNMKEAVLEVRRVA